MQHFGIAAACTRPEGIAGLQYDDFTPEFRDGLRYAQADDAGADDGAINPVGGQLNLRCSARLVTCLSLDRVELHTRAHVNATRTKAAISTTAPPMSDTG